MDDILSWTVVGAIITALIGIGWPIARWFLRLGAMVAKAQREVSKMLAMHEHADDFGFGTEETNQLIMANREMVKTMTADNRRGMKELVHYIKWFVEVQTGEKPPPYVENIDG